ncbi:MAG: MarC family protein [Acetobacteraceae bacterium]|nr:MarC family protein [Acetobacteraceae bacterium]
MLQDPNGVQRLLEALQLGFPALFSIVNPIGGAFVFQAMTGGSDANTQARLARLVALYSLAVLIVSLWAGSFVLSFFGVSLAALRCAGGSVIALNAWRLLNAPDREAVETTKASADMAFFPLTMPLTAGPGTISVGVALSSKHPRAFEGLGWYFGGMSLAAIAVAGTIWLGYRNAYLITRLFGEHGARTFGRLMAFLLLCIGVQVLITGVQDVFGPLLGHAPEGG